MLGTCPSLLQTSFLATTEGGGVFSLPCFDRHPHITWTGCTCHSIDLLLEDLAKQPWVDETIKHVKLAIQFIKGHHLTHSLFREHCPRLELLKPGQLLSFEVNAAAAAACLDHACLLVCSCQPLGAPRKAGYESSIGFGIRDCHLAALFSNASCVSW